MGLARVTDEHRRRLLVDRHLLGGRGRADRTVSEVAGAFALMHSTDPSTPYLSLHARADVSPLDVDHALYVERSLFRHTTIRRTVFVMPLDVVALAHGAYNGRLVATLRKRLIGWIDASPDTTVAAEAFLRATELAVIELLRTEGPMTGVALAAVVPALQVRFDPMPSATSARPMRITSRVLELLAAEGRIARGRPTGRDFTSASWTWQLTDDWLGTPGLEQMDGGAALAGLLERHLATFGPATVTDLSWWSGLPKGQIRAALDGLRARPVALDGISESGYVLTDDSLDAPADDGVVALLPGLDSTTMGWKQRTWYVDDRPSAGLFDRNGNAGPTIWLDGRVVGTWTQHADGEIAVDLVADIGSDAVAAVEAEAERTADWLGPTRVKWRYPTPRTRRLLDA